MSAANLTVTFAAQTEALAAAIREVSEAIGKHLLPAIEEAARVMREWYASFPGMPYTAPSLWDADQMIGDRGDR